MPYAVSHMINFGGLFFFVVFVLLHAIPRPENTYE
nr:MAG TPA: hypothetical protein [Caudoviricetes sp.]